MNLSFPSVFMDVSVLSNTHIAWKTDICDVLKVPKCTAEDCLTHTRPRRKWIQSTPNSLLDCKCNDLKIGQRNLQGTQGKSTRRGGARLYSLRQVDLYEFNANFVYKEFQASQAVLVRLCLKKIRKEKGKMYFEGSIWKLCETTSLAGLLFAMWTRLAWSLWRYIFLCLLNTSITDVKHCIWLSFVAVAWKIKYFIIEWQFSTCSL